MVFCLGRGLTPFVFNINFKRNLQLKHLMRSAKSLRMSQLTTLGCNGFQVFFFNLEKCIQQFSYLRPDSTDNQM